MRIIVRRDDGTERDVTEAVQITYDCLRASLDWSSGFLDTHEVNAVVILAEAAGFPDFEDLVVGVWESRRREAGAERRAITEADRAALLHEIHGDPAPAHSEGSTRHGGDAA